MANRYFVYFYVRAGAYTFLHKPGAADIWQNLYEFPLVQAGKEVAEEEVPGLPGYVRLFGGCEVQSVRMVARQVKHVLSHRVIYADCYEITLAEGEMPQGAFQKVLMEDVHKFAVPRLISRFFSLLLKPNI